MATKQELMDMYYGKTPWSWDAMPKDLSQPLFEGAAKLIDTDGRVSYSPYFTQAEWDAEQKRSQDWVAASTASYLNSTPSFLQGDIGKGVSVAKKIEENPYVAMRDAVETAGVITGNYLLPGSSLLTGNLASNGSQNQLNTDVGKVVNLAAGAGGVYNGNLDNYGKIYDFATGTTPPSTGAVGTTANTAGTGAAGTAAGGGLMSGIKDWANEVSKNTGGTGDVYKDFINGLKGTDWKSLAGIGLTAGGASLNADAAKEAAQINADAQIKAAQIAADAAKFRPVGVTTNFGSSNFTKDAEGNVTDAGYTLAPWLQAQQDTLRGGTSGLLTQGQNAVGLTAPMQTAATNAMTLGNQYLSTDPAVQAQKYYDQQQALLSTNRNRDLSSLQTQMFNQGRSGLGVGAVGQMGAANPELEAFYNAQRQQDLGLAANATQGGMDYAKFGAGMVGTGGDMLNSMYSTQSNAYDPYKNSLGLMSSQEGFGKNAMDLGTSIGSQVSTANAQAGSLTANGMVNAANTMQPVNSYSGWGSLLSGAGNTLSGMGTQQTQQTQQNQLAQLLSTWGK